MELPIYQIDAFTTELFRGNPAAVVPLERWLADEAMQAIAAENNLSETASIVPTPDAAESDFQLRWFTPATEVDLCGHATLATAHVLFEHLGFEEPIVRFGSKSGILAVTREGRRLVLDFPARRAVPAAVSPALIEALGATPRESHDSGSILAVFAAESEVRALRPDFVRLADINTHAVCVTAPGDEVDFVSRFFAPRVGINEDPVTGSAHCTLTPYWAERMGKAELHARQISQRGGELHCRLAGDRVHIGGEAVTYMQGTINV